MVGEDKPKADGFLGMAIGELTEGDVKGIDGGEGEAGRLANELMVGVLGVLEGRGPGSMGRIGKLLNTPPSLRVSRETAEVLMAIGRTPTPPVGTEGSCNPVISSSSSIDGKC